MQTGFDRFLSRVEYTTDTLAIGGMLVCVVVVAADVFARYVMNSPMSWVQDVLVLYALPGIFFMGLPGSYQKGAHVAVDVIFGYVSTRARLKLTLFGRLLTAIVFASIAYYGALRVLEAFRQGEIQPGIIANWPIWPSVLLVPVGCFFALLRAVERFVVEIGLLGAGDREILRVIASTEGNQLEEAV